MKNREENVKGKLEDSIDDLIRKLSDKVKDKMPGLAIVTKVAVGDYGVPEAELAPILGNYFEFLREPMEAITSLIGRAMESKEKEFIGPNVVFSTFILIDEILKENAEELQKRDVHPGWLTAFAYGYLIQQLVLKGYIVPFDKLYKLWKDEK